MARRRETVNYATPSDAELGQIITDPESGRLLVSWADRIGEALAQEKLSTSQIRALFGEVRQIQGDWSINRGRALRRLMLLRPKMAYRVKKEDSSRNHAVQMLVSVLDPAVKLVVDRQPRSTTEPAGSGDNQDDNFQRFVEFFEAILAYHKAHGGS